MFGFLFRRVALSWRPEPAAKFSGARRGAWRSGEKEAVGKERRAGGRQSCARLQLGGGARARGSGSAAGSSCRRARRRRGERGRRRSMEVNVFACQTGPTEEERKSAPKLHFKLQPYWPSVLAAASSQPVAIHGHRWRSQRDTISDQSKARRDCDRHLQMRVQLRRRRRLERDKRETEIETSGELFLARNESTSCHLGTKAIASDLDGRRILNLFCFELGETIVVKNWWRNSRREHKCNQVPSASRELATNPKEQRPNGRARVSL